MYRTYPSAYLQSYAAGTAPFSVLTSIGSSHDTSPARCSTATCVVCAPSPVTRTVIPVNRIAGSPDSVGTTSVNPAAPVTCVTPGR